MSKAAAMTMMLPARDGTILEARLHPSESGVIDGESHLDFGAATSGGVRWVISYRVSSVMLVDNSLGLHHGDPGLTVERHWLTVLRDWIQLFVEWSVDRPGGNHG